MAGRLVMMEVMGVAGAEVFGCSVFGIREGEERRSWALGVWEGVQDGRGEW
jgi:hypothetical protein